MILDCISQITLDEAICFVCAASYKPNSVTPLCWGSPDHPVMRTKRHDILVLTANYAGGTFHVSIATITDWADTLCTAPHIERLSNYLQSWCV